MSDGDLTDSMVIRATNEPRLDFTLSMVLKWCHWMSRKSLH
jgi:hypothetical protein